jgi:AcrR family transcriptional regulator
VARSEARPKESLVERRQRRVRRELAAVALELFFTQGYDATTIEEIVDAVEISPSTFYRHFPKKSDLVVEYSRQRMRDFGEHLAARPPTEPIPEAFDAAIETFVESLGSGTASLRNFEKLLEENPELRGHVIGVLFDFLPTVEELIATRLDLEVGDVRTVVITAAIGTTMRLAFERWSRSGDDRSLAASLHEAIDVLTPLFAGATS